MKVYSLKEAAEVLGVSERTMRRHAKAGKIRWFRVGQQIRITEDALKEYISALEREAEKERTKSLDELQNKLQGLMPILRDQYQVKSLELFGSYVRGKQRPDSDLDVLVAFYEKPGLFRFVELRLFLEDALGVEIDLVLKDTLKPRIGQHILQEAMAV